MHEKKLAKHPKSESQIGVFAPRPLLKQAAPLPPKQAAPPRFLTCVVTATLRGSVLWEQWEGEGVRQGERKKEHQQDEEEGEQENREEEGKQEKHEEEEEGEA